MLKKFGPNEIVEGKKKSSLSILISQFTSFLIFLLALAALISLILGDILDGIFILLVVVLNGLLGFVQEFKAEKAIEALKKITISRVRVFRDAVETEIDSRFLVPGDVFFIEEGVRIPADGQILEGLNLEVNEASLTGESLPVLKRTEAEGDEEAVFAGTVVARGRGRVEVTATGMNTRFGRIALGLQNIEEEGTPLQKKIESLGRGLGIFGIAASLSILILSILRGNPPFESFLTSISLAVAAVPEGLPAVITIALAVGVQRMSRQAAIVRKLTSVEALGSTSVIVTDKTGTLTKGEMRVKEIWFDGKFFSLRDLIKDQTQNETLQKIVEVSSICSSASLVIKNDSRSFNILGDSTEGALLLMVNDLGRNVEGLRTDGRLLEEYPFDAQRKTMSVLFSRGSKPFVLTKGAPETLLTFSDRLFFQGKIIPLDKGKREEIERGYKESAAVGLRIIAFSFREVLGERGYPRDEVEKEQVFLGFTGIYDPPREEVKEAIKVCREAGIRVVMVTGDNPLTAKAVASEIGLAQEGDDILTGKQLEAYSGESLKTVLPKVRIFARTTPEQKFQIVKAYQELGEVIAVTGDGVNDALALKQADVGVAMGITGTDVAKEAADIIVTDDNFASITKAVEEGRIIFENVKSAVKYLIGCNLGEISAVLIAVVLGWPLILTPLQLLYVNLVTDGLPAVALAVTPKHSGIMRKPPRRSSSILGFSDLPWFFEASLITALLTLAAFYLGNLESLVLGRTLAFTVIIFVQQFILIDVWSREESALKVKNWKSVWLLLAFLFPLIIHPFLIYTSALAEIFKITPSRPELLVFVVFLSFLTLVASEVRKRMAKK